MYVERGRKDTEVLGKIRGNMVVGVIDQTKNPTTRTTTEVIPRSLATDNNRTFS